MTTKLRDMTWTKAYHLEVCDECICECPIKLNAWKKASFWERMTLENPDDCNCFEDKEEKINHFKKILRGDWD